jgi:hypothetical protein
LKTIINARDIRVLQTLGSFELLSTRQLCTLSFPGVDRRTVLRRLRKLEREKVIRRIHGLKMGEMVWALSQFGAFRIGQTQRIESINKNSLEHDITLSDIRLSLLRAGLAHSWKSEQHIRRNSGSKAKLGDEQIIPDAVFVGKTHRGFEVFALELELSGKSPSRYARLFSYYGCRSQFAAIWYVTASKSLGERLVREWKKANPRITKPAFGWIHLPQILSDPHSAKVRCGDQDTPIGSILCGHPKVPTPSTTV